MSSSRRDFLGAGAALLTARAYAQVKGANDRMRIGVIGCGGQAMGHMRSLIRMKEQDNCEIVAVCDIYRKRLDEAAQLTGGKPYKSYHDLLAAKDIDYVLIATPEHWHAKQTIDALSAGKHVYCEKPMTRTVEDAKKVVAKAKATPNLKVQIGVQGLSDESYETAYKYVQDGALGHVVLAQIDYSRNHKDDFFEYKIDETAHPGEDLDWNAFLGPARKRPWDPDRFFSWRRYWDYSAGISSDLFIHRVTRIIRSLGLTFPERAVATGGKYEFPKSTAEIPDTMCALLEYPGGLTVQLISSMANDTKVPHLLRGHKATLEFTQTGFTITPQGLFKDETKPVTYEKKGSESVPLHHRNLMAAIRSNEPLKCDVNIGYYGVVASEMATLSMRQRRYLAWDKSRERIVHA